MGCNGMPGGQSGMILLEVNTHLTSYRIQEYITFPDQRHMVKVWYFV